MAESYFSYWGKASSQDKEGDAYHLLPFHAMDVAACARKLLDLPHFSLRLLAEELGWPQRQVEALFVFFMALHDQGKFARAFQGLLPEPIPGLVPPNPVKRYNQRWGGGCGAFPAYAGMNRSSSAAGSRCASVPRACGDDPW